MNKKGVVFTVITVILLSVILLAFFINLENRAKIEMQKITVKVETVNNFVNTLNNQYLPLALRTSANQVILSLLKYIEESHGFLSDAQDIDSIFKKALIDGKYIDDSSLELMDIDDLDYTIEEVLGEVVRLADETGISLSISDINQDTLIEIKQEDAWNLNVSIEISYDVVDSENEVKWNVEDKKISTLLNINNYRDPVHLVNTGLNVSIRKTEITEWNIDNFKEFIFNLEFNSFNGAPSFLQRLQGDLSADPDGFGIETILDPYYHDNPDRDSNVDYQFYNEIDGDCTVDGLPNNFRLDEYHFTNVYTNLEGSCDEGGEEEELT